MTEKELVAQTSLGKLQGIQSGTIIQFRGVPFAKPPTKDLRFMPPQKMSPWEGVKLATQHGPIPPQPASRLSFVVGGFSRPQDENCLTLTISTPAVDNKARPVLVFLHGGAYSTGAGSLDWYDGSVLAHEGDMVVVNVNYRLGPLGFFYQPEISDGKAGTQDILAALEWVRENIENFGGDTEHITVMGQSAGGHAIMIMLAMPETRNLFHRAILQSTPVGAPPFSESKASEYGKQFLNLLGISGSPKEAAERLKAESTANLNLAMGKLAQATSGIGSISPPFMPVYDQISTTERFIHAAAEGAEKARIDIIIGTNGQEANAFLKVPPIQQPDPTLVSHQFKTLSGQNDAMEKYCAYHPGSTTIDLLSDLITDQYFLLPSLRFAEAASEAGARTWVYQFDWSPPTSPFKACHCLELPLTFGTIPAFNNAAMLKGAEPATVNDLSVAIRHNWEAFVRSGNPEIRIPWPQYQVECKKTMQFADYIRSIGDLGGLTWRYHS